MDTTAHCPSPPPAPIIRPADPSSPNSELREIIVEFLDHSNEEKYDRLVADDKIKHPFKRRLSANSNESRSNSPPQPAATATIVRQSTVMPKPHAADGGPSTASGHSRKNVPKKTRYEHQSHSSLSSSSTSSSSTLPVDGPIEAQRNANGKRSAHGMRRRPNAPNAERETCEETLARRQKQIDYGKNTIGYDRYIQTVPKSERSLDEPWTPPKHNKYSRRGWDGLVKVWRRKLHSWDPQGGAAAAADGDGVAPLASDEADKRASAAPNAVAEEDSSDDDAILASDDDDYDLLDDDDD